MAAGYTPPSRQQMARFLSEFEELRARVKRLEKTTGGQKASLREAVVTSRQLPIGGKTGEIIRKQSETDGDAFWSSEVLGQMVTYFIDLKAGAATWSAYAGNVNDGNEESIVPALTLGEDGTTMFPIFTPDLDQFPVNLVITVFPGSDLEEFTLYLPASTSFYGNIAPFWSMQIYNLSATNRARVNIADTSLVYAGTTVPVNGDERVWDLAPDYVGGWHVVNSYFSGMYSAATPFSVGTETFTPTAHVRVEDRYYMLNVGGRRYSFAFSAGGELVPTTGEPAHAFTNDAPSAIYITRIRATVGEAPTGGPIRIDVLRNGLTSILTTPLTIAAGTTTAIGDIAPIPWVDPTGGTIAMAEWEPGDFFTVVILEVGSTTAGSALTVQVWAG